MSLIRFFHDPSYTSDEFFYDMNNGRQGSRRGESFESQAVSKPFSPRMDVHEDSESNTVTATFELPGLKKEQVTIDVHDGRLLVSGQTTSDTEKSENGYTVRERRSGKFSRSLTLPRGTKPDNITAKMEDGILKITFPKTHPDETPSRITIA